MAKKSLLGHHFNENVIKHICTFFNAYLWKYQWQNVCTFITHGKGKVYSQMKIYAYNGKSNIIGAKVRDARRELGYSQYDLALRLQLENVIITQKCISRIENFERFVADYELRAISIALKKPVEWFLDTESDGRFN